MSSSLSSLCFNPFPPYQTPFTYADDNLPLEEFEHMDLRDSASDPREQTRALGTDIFKEAGHLLATVSEEDKELDDTSRFAQSSLIESTRSPVAKSRDPLDEAMDVSELPSPASSNGYCPSPPLPTNRTSPRKREFSLINERDSSYSKNTEKKEVQSSLRRRTEGVFTNTPSLHFPATS